MFDFPTSPVVGTTVTTPDGAVRSWDGVKWKASQGGSGGADSSNSTVIAQNATIARSLANRFADRYSVEDWLTPGQPDGVTDNTAQLQAALDAAAGLPTLPTDTQRAAAPGSATLLIPANVNIYIVGALKIPSNTNLIIEHGAYLKLAPQTNNNMFTLVSFAHHVTIELYGTLDGNSPQQSFEPTDAVSPPPTNKQPNSISGGIKVDRIYGGPTRNPMVQGGFCSHVKITGDRNGLITNFQNEAVGLTGPTNCEVSNISMTNSAFHAGSIGVTGWRNFPYNPATGLPITFSGNYVVATNTVTLTTATPHYMVPGEEFILENITGVAPIYSQATGILLFALPGTSGNTIVYRGRGGGVDTAIAGGRITNWYYQQATIGGGTYIPATGLVTVTTGSPHQLVYGQMISSNITGGTAASVATGLFQLLDVTYGQGEPALASAKNVTLRYRAGKTGTMMIVSSGSYDGPSGVVTLTMAAPHGLSVNDVITTGLSGSGFLSGIGGDQACIVGTTGSTIKYQGPVNIPRSSPVITGGTITGGPTLSITAGTIGVSTKVWDTGFDNCFIDQIRDIGPCIYGGGVNCYIRRSEITRNIGSGPYIFSDANSGRSINCEISGNYIHDNFGSGVGTVNFGPYVGSGWNIEHKDIRIFNNYIVGNYGGASFGSVDGLECINNYFYQNRVQGTSTYGSVGEITAIFANRVKIAGNTIRDPCVLNSIRGSSVLQIASGTYNNVTGAVALTMGPTLYTGDRLFTNAYFTLSGLTGTGAFTSLAGRWIVESVAPTNSINFHAPAGLGTVTITGGQVTPNGFGIAVHSCNYLYIANNYIADHQNPPTMLAAIGGTWGVNGICTGNYYGPRINSGGNFPADMSSGAQAGGNNFDTVTGFTDGSTLKQPYSGASTESFPPIGVAVGYNRSGGRGETTFYIGAANANPGGFEFVKTIGLSLVGGGTYTSITGTVASSGNTYNNATGQVTLTTTAPHGIGVNASFTLANVTIAIPTDPDPTVSLNGNWVTMAGTTGSTLVFMVPGNLGSITVTGGAISSAIVSLVTRTPHGLIVGTRFTLSLTLASTSTSGGSATDLGDVHYLNGAWIATADGTGTSGTALSFVLTDGSRKPLTGLDLLNITAGAINNSEMDSGLIDATVGLPTGAPGDQTAGGSLLSIDGYGNMRLSGAVVHGAMQSQVVTTGQTLTILPNRSFVHVQNAGTIAALTIAMPTFSASAYQGTGSEMEINFDNPVTTLSWSGTAPSGAPTSITTAHNSIQFIRDAGTWYRRIMM